MQSRGNTVPIVAALLASLAFGAVTYFTVEQAGGTKLSPDYSNTPNGTVPGPPGVK